MVSWSKIYKKGKMPEKAFIHWCNRNNHLCVKSNDLLYFLLKRRIPPYPAYNSNNYRQNIKKIAKKLAGKNLRFLRNLGKKKGTHGTAEKPRPNREKMLIKRFIDMGVLKYFRLKCNSIDVFTVPGIPDFAVYDRGKKNIYFAEVKASKSTLSTIQKKIMKKMNRNNIDAIVVYPNKVKGWIEISAVS